MIEPEGTVMGDWQKARTDAVSEMFDAGSDESGIYQTTKLYLALDAAVHAALEAVVADDVRLDRVLPYKPARDAEDEKHVHPLQLDVIDRALVLWSNPGETVLTPFMGVGSEVYGAVCANRRGIGVELKPSYYRQAVKNLAEAGKVAEQQKLGPIFAGAAS